MLDAIAQMILSVLHLFQLFSGSYGMALVLLAVFIKLVLYLPTQQQYKSMRDLQRIQPEIEAVQKQYKDDPERSQKELLALYKRHNVNPLGGCFPLLIQMPILFAIWGAILGEPDLFGNAYFLWIHPGPLQGRFPGLFASSLAEPDLAMIIFYGLTMYLSQQLSSVQAKGAQKYMGLIMSVGFSYMVWHYRWPCALVLYWSVFTLLTIVQQSLIMRSNDGDKTAENQAEDGPEEEDAGGENTGNQAEDGPEEEDEDDAD